MFENPMTKIVDGLMQTPASQNILKKTLEQLLKEEPARFIADIFLPQYLKENSEAMLIAEALNRLNDTLKEILEVKKGA